MRRAVRLETKPYEERLKELNMFSFEKRTEGRDDSTFQILYLKSYHAGEGWDLSSIIPECRTCNNGLKL